MTADRDDDLLDEAFLTLEELCAAARVEREWLLRRVEEGLIPSSTSFASPPAAGRGAAAWRFTSVGLARVRRMRDIERTYDAAPELAALVADLLEELDALRARLRSAR